MARTTTKIGDIFEAKIDDTYKKYFQYIANDLTQLNSDVIRAFKKEYPLDALPELSEIVKDEVDFYAHCITKLGIKMNLWQKLGNILDVGELDIWFRSCNDYGIREGEKPRLVSQDWRVWKINEGFKQVGKLEEKYYKAEIGLVVNPFDIISRLKTGEYELKYPGY